MKIGEGRVEEILAWQGVEKVWKKMRKIYLPQEILDSVDFLKMRYKSMPVNAKTRKKLKTKMHISNGKSLNLIVFFIRIRHFIYIS